MKEQRTYNDLKTETLEVYESPSSKAFSVSHQTVIVTSGDGEANNPQPGGWN